MPRVIARSTNESSTATAAEDDVADPRVRRRRRTRSHIADVAQRLVVERGYDHVTVDDIAEAADIAPRTFFRYFTSKDELFFLDLDERFERLGADLAARPRTEPVLVAVRAAMLALADDLELDREHTVRMAQVIAQTPALRAYTLDRRGEWRDVVVAVVAERLGVDPDTDLRSQVIGAATLGALGVAIRLWGAEGSTAGLRELTSEALRVLEDLGNDR